MIEWIKLSTRTFKDEKIQLIEAMPNGDSILVIWFKLLVQAGLCNEGGRLMMNGMPLATRMMAILFQRSEMQIEQALGVLMQWEMVAEEKMLIGDRVVEVFYIVNWEKHQNVDGMDRLREKWREDKKRQRAKKLPPAKADANPSGGNVHGHGDGHVHPSPPTEKERELEKENDAGYQERARNGNGEESQPLPFENASKPKPSDLPGNADFTPVPQDLQDFASSKLKQSMLSANDYNTLSEWLKAGVPVEVIQAGIEKAFRNHKPKNRFDKIRSLNYCEGAVSDIWARLQVEQARAGAAPANEDHAETTPTIGTQADQIDEDEIQALLKRMQS